MKIKLTESQIQTILTESTPQLLNEVAWVQSTIDRINGGFIPLTPSIVKLLTGDNRKVDVFHISDVENIDNMYNVINKRNTISSFSYFSESNLQSLRGIKTEGGVLYHVTGNLVFQSTDDVFSVVDNSLNRRWVYTNLISANLRDDIEYNLVNDTDGYTYIKKFYKILLNGIEKYKDEIRHNLIKLVINKPNWGLWNEILVSNIKINDILWNPNVAINDMEIEDQEKFLNLIEEVGVKLNKLAPGNVYLKDNDDEITQWFKDRGGFNDIEDYIYGNANKILKSDDEKNLESIRKLGFETPVPGKGYVDENGKQGLWGGTIDDGGNYEVTYVDGMKNGLYSEYKNGELHNQWYV